MEDDVSKESNSWSANVQYDYKSYSSSSDRKTTLNLLLDKKINENLTLHGNFFKTNDSTYTPNDTTNIRELYIDSSVIKNTSIKIGKIAFKTDNKKGVQDLNSSSVEELYEPTLCGTSSDNEFNECIGIDSIHVESKLSDSIQVELLKTVDRRTYPLTRIESSKARLKYSKNNFDYYVTVDKSRLDGANALFFGNRANDSNSVEFSLEERMSGEKSNQWYAKIKHTKANGGDSLLYPEYVCAFTNYTPIEAFSHSNGLTLGKVLSVDKLLINSSFRREAITNNALCLNSPQTKTFFNSAGFMLEYPLKHGKITAHHRINKTSLFSSGFSYGVFPSFKNINTTFSSIQLIHNFDKNWSSRLGYYSSKFEFIPNSVFEQKVSMYSLKYKF